MSAHHALHEKGLILASQGNLAGAADLFQQSLNKDDSWESAHVVRNNFGNVLADLGKLEQAREQYEKAIELKSDFVEAHRNLAIILTDLDLKEEAIDEYENCLNLKEDSDIHYNIGNLHSDLNHFELAEKHYRRSLGIKPSAHAHNNLGMLLHARGQTYSAAAHYGEAIKLDSNCQDALCNMGVCLRAMGDTAGAMRRLEQTLFVDARSHKAHYQLGCVKSLLGLHSAAADHFREAVRYCPESALYRVALVLVLRSLRLDKEMKEVVGPVLASLARSVTVADGKGIQSARDLAMLLLLTNRHEDAMKVLSRIPSSAGSYQIPGEYVKSAVTLSKLPARGGEISQSTVAMWVQLCRRGGDRLMCVARVIRHEMDDDSKKEAVKGMCGDAEEMVASISSNTDDGDERGDGYLWVLEREGVGMESSHCASCDPMNLFTKLSPGVSYLLRLEPANPFILDERKCSLRMLLLVSLHFGSYLFSEGITMVASKPYNPKSEDPAAQFTSLIKQRDANFVFENSQAVASAVCGETWSKFQSCAFKAATAVTPLLKAGDIATSSASASNNNNNNSATAAATEVVFQIFSLDFALGAGGEAKLTAVSENYDFDRGGYTLTVWTNCVSIALATVPVALCGMTADVYGDSKDLSSVNEPAWVQLSTTTAA